MTALMNAQQSIRLTARGTIDRRIKPIPFATDGPLFWYFVGLVATDGCLYQDGRHVEITAKEKAYLYTLRKTLNLRSNVYEKKNGRGQIAHHIQICSTLLYAKLIELGLTPKKSLTIGPLHVPDHGFADFLRGVIDGDGNIRRWRHPTNAREQWVLRVYSSSKPFVQWLQEVIERLWNTTGILHLKKNPAPYQPGYTLKYGKLAAKTILRQCYYPGALALERKRKLAAECVAAPVGWLKSKTVANETERRLWQYSRKEYVMVGRGG